MTRKAVRTDFGWYYGNGVFEVLGSDFGENLSLLKEVNPGLVVVSICPIVRGYKGVETVGLIVVCEKSSVI